MNTRGALFFTSPEHKQRLLTALQDTGKMDGKKVDAEYAAALYLLTANAHLWKQAKAYTSRDGLDIASMIAEIDLTGGSIVLMMLAGNLFNGGQHIDPLEFTRLDEGNYHAAMTAITIRFYGIQVSHLL